MIRFRCLGSVELTDADGSSLVEVLSQPRRVALLSYIALFNHGGFVPRDRLLEVFWPESDTERARNSLNQALHQLRSTLGRDAFETRGRHELRLNRKVVWCDALAFREAAEGGRVDEAMELYRGDLLEGLHAANGAGFEHWLDEERTRLRRSLCDAAWAKAERAEAKGDAGGALGAAREAVAKAPFDEIALRRLMELLARLGDRAEAVRAYERFVDRLAKDLDVEPDPETVELAGRLRAIGEQSGSRGVSASRASTPTESRPAHGSRGPPSSGPAASNPAPRRRLWPLAVAAGVGTLAVMFGLRLGDRADPPAAELSLAVLPLSNLSAAQGDEYFALGLTDEIITRLGAFSDLRVTSRPSIMQYLDTSKDAASIADELGVRYLLTGSVQALEGDLRVRLQLVDAIEDTPIWTETFDAALKDLFSVQTRIAGRVAGSIRETLGPMELAALSEPPTQSAEAYVHYLRAKSHRMESWRPWADEDSMLLAAADAFQRAVDADPDFALAYAEMSMNDGGLYWFGTDRSDARRERAHAAVNRAEELDPDNPRIRLARAHYLYLVEQRYDESLAIAEQLEGTLLNDPDRLFIVAFAHRRQKRFELAAEEIEQLIAVDPLAGRFHYELFSTSHRLRRPEGMKRGVDGMIGIEWRCPWCWKFRLAARLGDLNRARAVLDSAMTAEGRSWCVACQLDMARWDRDYEGMITAVDRATDRIVNSQGDLFPSDRARWRAHWARGDTAEARRAVEAWLPFLEEQDNDAVLPEAYAYAGRPEDAVRRATRGWGGRDEPIYMTTDLWAGENKFRELLARILVVNGDADGAMDQLDIVLEMDPYPWLNGTQLRMEPWWDPIRHLPRFHELLARYDSVDAFHGWDVEGFNSQIEAKLATIDARWVQ